MLFFIYVKCLICNYCHTLKTIGPESCFRFNLSSILTVYLAYSDFFSILLSFVKNFQCTPLKFSSKLTQIAKESLRRSFRKKFINLAIKWNAYSFYWNIVKYFCFIWISSIFYWFTIFYLVLYHFDFNVNVEF